MLQTEIIIISARNFYMKQWREATNQRATNWMCVPFRLKDGGAREKGCWEQLTSQNKHKREAASVEDVRRKSVKSLKHGDTKFALGAGG